MQHPYTSAARAAFPQPSFRPVRHWSGLTLLAALLLLLLVGARSARAQTTVQPDRPLYVTNGPVSAVVRDGGTVYIGGSFTYVGPNNPNGTALNVGTGAPDLRFARPNGTALNVGTGAPDLRFARPNGLVRAAVPDGAGGWYIGGDFTTVGGLARNRLAQLDASGAVTAFNPNANNSVRALAVAGGTVYAGGDFTTIGGQARNRLAALNAADGLALAAFNPNANSSVFALAVAGGTVYAGGQFTSIGGQARSRLAALNAADGLAVAAFNPDANGTVQALALAGGTVYAGGDFTTIGGQPRQSLVALNATTGVPLPVELSAFTAVAAGPAAVRLAWATASEKNSAAFEVERSLDGRTFATIGTVAAAGSSSAPRTYSLLDAQLPAGAGPLYYRLRMVDADGTFAYSPVRVMAGRGGVVSAAARLVLAPNPAAGRRSTLSGAAAGAAVQVFDVLGRPVLTVPADAAGTAPLVLPAALPAGVYLVRAGTQTGRLVVE